MPTDASVASRIDVVLAQVSDVELLAPLFDAYRQFYGAASDVTAASGFLSLRLRRSESIVLLARYAPSGASEPRAGIGFAQLYRSFSSVALMPSLILNDLYVAEAWRACGVGRRLTNEAIAFATSERAATLEIATQHTNHRALALYESVGFARDREFVHLSLALQPSTANVSELT